MKAAVCAFTLAALSFCDAASVTSNHTSKYDHSTTTSSVSPSTLSTTTAKTSTTDRPDVKVYTYYMNSDYCTPADNNKYFYNHKDKIYLLSWNDSLTRHPVQSCMYTIVSYKNDGIKLTIEELEIDDDNVDVNIYFGPTNTVNLKYTLTRGSSSRRRAYFANSKYMTIELINRNMSTNFNFKFYLQSNNYHASAIGGIIGITIGSVVFFILLMVLCGVCCRKRYRRRQRLAAMNAPLITTTSATYPVGQTPYQIHYGSVTQTPNYPAPPAYREKS